MEQRIIILGAGFGGVSAARALTRRAPPGTSVEIIDEENYFVFQPLLPEVAAGSIHASDAVTPLRLMLPRAQTRQAHIAAIDFSAREVEVVQGLRRNLVRLPYDHLVLALGQETNLGRYPGMSEHAFTMKDVADAYRLRSHVINCLEQADIAEDADLKRRLLTFVVVGGGLSGVETLGEVEHLISRALRFYPNLSRRDIRLVLVEYQPAILPEVAPPLAQYAARLLQERGAEIVTGVGVKNASQESVELADGRVVNTLTVVATIGNAPSPLVQSLPLPKQKGKIVTDAFLRVPGHENVWAVGDVAAIPIDGGAKDNGPGDGEMGGGALAPPTAQAAVQEAERLAANLLASIAGKTMRPFHYEHRGQLASLGGRRGVADLFGRHISGFFAWLLWRSIYLGMMPTWVTRMRVAADWLLDSVLPRNTVQIAMHCTPSIRRQHFRRGDVVFRRGEVSGPFYIVGSGSFRRDTTGRQDLVGPGQHFGEGVLEGERLRRSTVTAEQDGVCVVLDSDDLRRLAHCMDALEPYLADLHRMAGRQAAPRSRASP